MENIINDLLLELEHFSNLLYVRTLPSVAELFVYLQTGLIWVTHRPLLNQI